MSSTITFGDIRAAMERDEALPEGWHQVQNARDYVAGRLRHTPWANAPHRARWGDPGVPVWAVEERGDLLDQLEHGHRADRLLLVALHQGAALTLGSLPRAVSLRWLTGWLVARTRRALDTRWSPIFEDDTRPHEALELKRGHLDGAVSGMALTQGSWRAADAAHVALGGTHDPAHARRLTGATRQTSPRHFAAAHSVAMASAELARESPRPDQLGAIARRLIHAEESVARGLAPPRSTRKSAAHTALITALCQDACAELHRRQDEAER